jgi:iron complex outermembrane recepter protein
MRKRLLLFKPYLVYWFFFLHCLQANAQSSSGMTVICRTPENTIVPSTTLFLFRQADSSLYRTAITNNKGSHTFPDIPNGAYYITVSHVNLEATPLSFSLTRPDTSLSIVMLPRTTVLTGVTVRGQKALVETKDNKLIFNNNERLSKASGNALDILGKAPGVSIGREDNLALFGQTNLLIKLNGKQVFGTREEAIRYLKTLPPGSITSIEIIAAPGAEYENAYAGGIINIITKKDDKEGARMSLTSTNSWGEFYRGLLGYNITYRKKKLSLSSTITFAHNNFYERKNFDQSLTLGAGSILINQQTRSLTTANDFQGRIMADYKVNAKTTIGFNFSTVQADRDSRLSHSTVNRNSPSFAIDSVVDLHEDQDASIKRYFGNINFAHQFDSTGKRLTGDVNILIDNATASSVFSHAYHDGASHEIRPPLILLAQIPGDIRIVNGRLDYFVPLKKGYSFKIGGKLVFSEIENNVRYDSFYNNTAKPDLYRTSFNVFDERIGALYGILTHSSGKKWSWEAGLRYEAARVGGESKITNTTFKRNFSGFFPNASATYRFDKNNQLTLSVRKSVIRPDYQKLNPFIQYITQNLYIQGNPNLQQYSAYTVQTMYTLKSKYVFTLRYDYKHNYIPQTALVRESINSTVTKQTYDNIASGGGVQLSMYLPFTVTKWWDMTVGVNAFSLYAKATRPGYEGFDYHNSNANISVTNVLQLPFGLFGLVQIDATTPFRVNQNELKGSYSIDYYLRKSFFKNMLSIGLSGKDLAYRDIRRGTSFFNGGRSVFYEKYDTRRFGIDIQYIFGRTKVQSVQRKNTGIEEEEGRIKK